jgi:deoxyribonuclease-4
MPYLPNLASPKDDTYWRSVETLTAELKRCSQLGIPYLVTHLGSHLGRGWGEGARRIVGAIEAALSQSDSRVMLLLENTAGTKNSMGGSFEDIARIIEELGDERVGVCLDTCHLFAAGYELRTESAFEETMARFDECIGVERLKVVHLNDSQGAFGSRLDRHEHIGLGRIGEEGLMVVLRSRALRDLPFILETPIDGRRDDRGNLMAARELASNEPMISRT